MKVVDLTRIVIPPEVSAHKDYDRIPLADIKMKVQLQQNVAVTKIELKFVRL